MFTYAVRSLGCIERRIAMRFVATKIIVLLSFCSITAVQAEQSNSCKQCREQQQACAKNYSAKTCKTEYDICMKEKITK